MKKFFLSLLLIASIMNVMSQTRSDETYKKIKKFIKINSAASSTRRDVYLNKADNIIEIGDFQIPLFDTKTSYSYNDNPANKSSHFVKFKCNNDGECIKQSLLDNYILGVYIPFKTKDNCYDFINLIDELKKNLK